MTEPYTVSITQARARIATARRLDLPPAREEEARAELFTASVDREIRRCRQVSGDARLTDAQAGHLVGLLLSVCHVPAEDACRIEREVRALAASHGARSSVETGA